LNILCIDIETLPIVLQTWDLKQEYNSHDNIIQESSIVCASWMLVDIDKKPSSVSVLDCMSRFNRSVYDDTHVVKTLHNVVNEADIILGQNSDNFDLKIINWRAKCHGLQPIKRMETIDTLKESRKVFRPPSHRLDYKGKALGHGGKIHMDMQDWRDITQYSYPPAGTKRDRDKAITTIKKMVRYNQRDVELDVELYLDERSWYKKHPNRLLYDPKVDGCPTCPSKDIRKKGFRRTATCTYQSYQCNSCGKQFQGTERLNKVDLKN